MRGPKATWKKIGKKTWLLWNFSEKKDNHIKYVLVMAFNLFAKVQKILHMDLKKTHS